ncbi:MAG: CatA-like O-acetyltransferase [Candidatus Cryptobacteroides sp.]
MTKKTDIENWSRREIYELFSPYSNPFYVVSFNVEIHNLYNFCKKNGIGVYHAMIWCITRAINSVPAFRQRIVKGEIVEYDRTFPSYTFLKAGEDAFKICTLSADEDIIGFDRKAKLAEASQTTLLGDYDLPPEPLIYLSCLPWIETTCITSERNLDRDDCIPRISWGKFRKNPDGSIMQNITVDTNHRLVDGYHIGLFGQSLQAAIDSM